MSTRKTDSRRHDGPTPDDSAGTPACKEETGSAAGVAKSRGVRVRGAAGHKVRGPQPAQSPTADELAGIPVTAEVDEDVTVRPRQSRKRA
ncbi:MAG: hypothetical protein L0Y72_22395 [Gemmataceae bacterium]|nr:hypothetical protein [Gemmataceae bacterium]MCI0741793.1 hypothetical protein [Gemmataceae bacterium]